MAGFRRSIARVSGQPPANTVVCIQIDDINQLESCPILLEALKEVSRTLLRETFKRARGVENLLPCMLTYAGTAGHVRGCAACFTFAACAALCLLHCVRRRRFWGWVCSWNCPALSSIIHTATSRLSCRLSACRCLRWLRLQKGSREAVRRPTTMCLGLRRRQMCALC